MDPADPTDDPTTELSAADRLAIAELIAAAAWALDTGDADAFVGTFTDDATLDMGEVHHGRDAIRRFVDAFVADDLSYPRGQHLVTGTVITPDSGGAVARSYVTRVHRLPMGGRGNTQVVWTGYAVDAVSRTQEGWRFASRRLRAWEGEKAPVELTPAG
ncbi:nuclear transport factor 2 family protein [Euzebya sp.]|uniref:nuclear transport factor 2 family protein n=1 Tax=Euzebya sp. TaxID=1971409 RepID=UPI003512AF04